MSPQNLETWRLWAKRGLLSPPQGEVLLESKSALLQHEVRRRLWCLGHATAEASGIGGTLTRTPPTRRSATFWDSSRRSPPWRYSSRSSRTRPDTPWCASRAAISRTCPNNRRGEMRRCFGPTARGAGPPRGSGGNRIHRRRGEQAAAGALREGRRQGRRRRRARLCVRESESAATTLQRGALHRRDMIKCPLSLLLVRQAARSRSTSWRTSFQETLSTATSLATSRHSSAVGRRAELSVVAESCGVTPPLRRCG